jgi:alanyl-tRNA synthetase
MRAVTIGICDGVIPSNEGRGYVMKKLIINVSDLAVTNGILNPVAYQLVHAVVEAMNFPYPDLITKEFEISHVIRGVEESYLKVRKERLPEFERKAREMGFADSDKLGQLVFTYRDTFGLTMPTIEKVLHSLNIPGDILKKVHVKFNGLMEEQQTKSRASSKMTGDVFAGAEIKLDLPKTKFLGYDQDSCEGTILKIYKDDKEISEAKEGDLVKIILDQTVFYAESGGQIGDTGTLWAPKVRIRVNDTQKINDIFIHYCVIEEGVIHSSDTLGSQIDELRRLAIMRNHTATHLLQAVLREILGPHVKQQGSLVADDRLRFDFTHPQAITSDEIRMIEDKVNRYILSCHEVKKESMSIEKAKQSGALAYFAEKYGDTVRVVTIGPFSKEFCGGTHLKVTGQIGPFKIFSEGAVAQGIRRIEAFTGMSTFEYMYMQENELKRTSILVKSPVLEVSGHVEQLTKKVKDLEKETEKMRMAVIQKDLDKIVHSAAELHGVKIISYVFAGVDKDVLGKVSDLIKQRTKSAVVILGSRTQEDAFLLITVSEDLVSKGLKAGELVKEIAPLMGGSGGGRQEMARAGSKSPEKIQSAVDQAVELIKGKIQS